ncbi:MAG: hypothetical protein JST68_22400 [Bacteroidetes bacterium]|nr:hypothetical protein [Bacteroidota bacterium]
MKKLILAFMAVLAIACSSSKHSTGNSTRDGSSYENAIVIKETSEKKGVDAEYDWLREHYPGYKRGRQALTTKNGKPYDVLSIETADGVKKDVYFDISKFFGKW